MQPTVLSMNSLIRLFLIQRSISCLFIATSTNLLVLDALKLCTPLIVPLVNGFHVPTANYDGCPGGIIYKGCRVTKFEVYSRIFTTIQLYNFVTFS